MGGQPSPPKSCLPSCSAHICQELAHFFSGERIKEKCIMIFELVNPCKKILHILNILVYGWPGAAAGFCRILYDVGFDGLHKLNPLISIYATRALFGAFSSMRDHGTPRRLFSLFFQATCRKSRTS